MGELARGGYSQQWRESVLSAAVVGYRRIWNSEVNSKGYVNRPDHVTKSKRRAAKLTGNSTWFQKTKQNTEDPTRTQIEHHQHQRKQQKKRTPAPNKPREVKIESVLFCPFTPNSTLKKQLQQEEDRINGIRATCRVRVVERAGPKIGDMLKNNKPWMKDHCGRQECAPCATKPGHCKVPNITYSIECLECSKVGKRAQYIGESSRTFYDRNLDHKRALTSQNSTYGVVRHWMDHPQT